MVFHFVLLWLSSILRVVRRLEYWSNGVMDTDFWILYNVSCLTLRDLRGCAASDLGFFFLPESCIMYPVSSSLLLNLPRIIPFLIQLLVIADLEAD